MFDLEKIKKSSDNLKELINLVPSEDVLELMRILSEAYREGQQCQRDLELINAQKEVILTEIHEKYALYHYVFEKIFDERKDAINKSFEIIDKGIEENDRCLTELGLKSLSQIVTSSPFSDLDKLSKLLDENHTIMI